MRILHEVLEQNPDDLRPSHFNVCPSGEMANASTPPRFAKWLIASTPDAGRMTKPSRGAHKPNSVSDQGLLQVIDHSARRNETESPSLPSSVSNSFGRSFSGSPMAL